MKKRQTVFFLFFLQSLEMVSIENQNKWFQQLFQTFRILPSLKEPIQVLPSSK